MMAVAILFSAWPAVADPLLDFNIDIVWGTLTVQTGSGTVLQTFNDLGSSQTLPTDLADLIAAEPIAPTYVQTAEAAREAARKKDNFIGVLGAGDITGIGKLLNDDPGLIAIKGENDETPLHWAAKNGRQVVAELLLTKGADVNARNGYDETPLHLAAFRGDRAMAELLMSKGADVNAEKRVVPPASPVPRRGEELPPERSQASEPGGGT
jgi:hypothetical protein